MASVQSTAPALAPPPPDSYEAPFHWLDVVTLFLWPIVYAGGCWAILLVPEVFEKILPWPVELNLTDEDAALASAANGTTRSLLNRSRDSTPLSRQEKGLLPRDRYSAWLAGRAAGRLEAPEASEEAHCQDAAEALEISAQLLDKDTVLNLGDLILVADRHGWEGLARLRGFFSLVNCLWAAAIIGLVFTFWPFLNAVAGPPVQWLLRHLLLPLYHLLAHLAPLWQLCAYLACLYLTAGALCFKRGAREGIAFSGWALSAATYSYLSNDVSGFVFLGLASTWFYAYATLSLVPLTAKFDSEFLGFCAGLSLLLALNTWIMPEICLWLLSSWPSDYVQLISCSGSSFLIVALLVGLKVYHLERLYGPFRLGLYFFGLVLFFAVWLLLVSYWCMSWTNLFWVKYVVVNVVILLILAGTYAFGTAIDFKSLTNTSVTFAALWLFTKIVDLAAMFGDNANIVAAFITFLAMWLAAWFLKTNPSWAQSLLP